MFCSSCFVIMSNAQKWETSVNIRETVPRMWLTLSQQIWKSSAAVVQILRLLLSTCLHSGLSHPYSAAQLTTNTKATLEIKVSRKQTVGQPCDHIPKDEANSAALRTAIQFSACKTVCARQVAVILIIWCVFLENNLFGNYIIFLIFQNTSY